jgi:poly-gamma-glutamate synthase PgsB/CapB
VNWKKNTSRKATEIAFLIAFVLIWLPRAIPHHSVVSLLWPIYHWFGVDYYFSLIRTPGILIGPIIAIFSAIFVREYVANSKAISKIPVRIHVTGIRGKTTTTRLIGAALRYQGLKTVTKTTGKAATLIDTEGGEHGIREHREQPNLREQQIIIGKVVADSHVDAIVFECMSIRPKNIIAESRFVRSTISVITNVRADHLDVMGPTLEDVAWTLSGMVSKKGTVVTAETKYLPIIRKRSEEKGARVVEAEPDSVHDEILSKFPYMVFKENIAIALKVCTLLGVSSENALKGMLEAKPDPGLVRILNAVIANQSVRLIAAFGVNDVDSTRVVFEELKRRGLIEAQRKLIGLFHAREDRVTRTLEFAQVMARMPFEKILVAGKMTNLFVSQATREGYRRENIVDLGMVDPSKIFSVFEKIALEENRGIALFGCGNMIGIEGFIHEFENLPQAHAAQVVGA